MAKGAAAVSSSFPAVCPPNSAREPSVSAYLTPRSAEKGKDDFALRPARKAKSKIGTAHAPPENLAAGFGAKGQRIPGGGEQTELKRVARHEEAAEARPKEFVNTPTRQGRLKLTADGLHKAGTGHARRAGKMAVEKRGRGDAVSRNGLKKRHLCHRRRKGWAGASWSRVMVTLCAPADQGAT